MFVCIRSLGVIPMCRPRVVAEFVYYTLDDIWQGIDVVIFLWFGSWQLHPKFLGE